MGNSILSEAKDLLWRRAKGESYFDSVKGTPTNRLNFDGNRRATGDPSPSARLRMN